ncbi:MAG: nicotinate-nucleotide diphosphorylase (carboxylating), partial [Gammaproteobacteria bacterium]
MNDYLFTFTDQIRQALKEDLGDAGDITSQAIIASDRIAEATLVSRQAGRICGLQTALSAFQILDPGVTIDIRVVDGADVGAGETLATLRGNARALLAAERTALNLLAHMCGIATVTNHAVVQIKEYSADVVCTRKTTPGLRALEKYAVRVGGGKNHR